MLTLLKRIAARLPRTWQQEVRRIVLRSRVRGDRFSACEPEYDLLDSWVAAGDWVIDVGANVGHYSARLSRLVGRSGRVVAFEPVPETFALLASNANSFAFANTTLVNAAASDRTAPVSMSIPLTGAGLDNYYRAHISGDDAGLHVLSFEIDSLAIPGRVSLVKIDAEGHELSVLRGMSRLIERDHPVLIVEEGGIPEIEALLAGAGYSSTQIPGSPNRVYAVSAEALVPR